MLWGGRVAKAIFGRLSRYSRSNSRLLFLPARSCSERGVKFAHPSSCSNVVQDCMRPATAILSMRKESNSDLRRRTMSREQVAALWRQSCSSDHGMLVSNVAQELARRSKLFWTTPQCSAASLRSFGYTKPPSSAVRRTYRSRSHAERVHTSGHAQSFRSVSDSP